MCRISAGPSPEEIERQRAEEEEKQRLLERTAKIFKARPLPR
jgi:hypothetical protein